MPVGKRTTGDANCSSSSSSSSINSISSVPGRSLRNAAGRFRSFASLAVDRSSVWLLTLCTLRDPDSGTGFARLINDRLGEKRTFIFCSGIICTGFSS